jgi:hypothetical protein
MDEKEKQEFSELIASDLDAGNLEKVVELFKYNKDLYHLMGELLKNGSMKVKLGATLLIEELKDIKPDDITLAIPSILPLLKSENPTVRGDAADLVGIIGDKNNLEFLTPLLKDPNRQVIEIAQDAIDELS